MVIENDDDGHSDNLKAVTVSENGYKFSVKKDSRSEKQDYLCIEQKSFLVHPQSTFP